MKYITFFLFGSLLIASSPFETPKEYSLDLSAFDTKRSELNKKVMENKKITCRYVCDKKIYKEQKIADAISFYKRTTQ